MISRHLITPQTALTWLYDGSSDHHTFDYDTAMAMAINLPKVIRGLIEFDEDGSIIQGQHELVAIAIQEDAAERAVVVRDRRKKKEEVN